MASSNLYFVCFVALILSYPIYNYRNKEINEKLEKAKNERQKLQAKIAEAASTLDESKMHVYSVMTPVDSLKMEE